MSPHHHVAWLEVTVDNPLSVSIPQGFTHPSEAGQVRDQVGLWSWTTFEHVREGLPAHEFHGAVRPPVGQLTDGIYWDDAGVL